MKKLLFVLQLLSICVFGQQTIRGEVIDKNGEPIVGANIYFEGSYDGSSTDTSGLFSFNTDLKGTQVLLASFVGYQEYRSVVDIGAGFELIIVLKEQISRMEAVVITASSFNADEDQKSPVLRPLDIVTTAGATADIAGALNTLPGTQTVGEEGRLFVRGGDAYETTTFIDGVLVIDSYNRTVPSVPTRSRFSPMMFKGVSFSTGGYSAEYGQGLSSALILKSKDVAVQNRSDISLMSVGIEGAHTQTFSRSSISAKIGYINLTPYYSLVDQSLDWITAPETLDGNISYRQEINKTGMLKVYGKFNISDMRLNYVTVDSTGNINTRIRNNFGHISTTYKEVLSDKWTLNAGAGYTSSIDRITTGDDRIEEFQEAGHAKIGFGVDLNKSVFLKFGGELFSLSNYQLYQAENRFSNRFSYEQWIYSFFAESEVFINANFLLRVGARFEHNTHSASIDPRVSVAHKAGKNGQISLAYGRFRQSPPKAYIRVSNSLQPEVATHFIGSYQWSRGNKMLRMETYWKEYDQLVKFDFANRYSPLGYSNDGSGYAKGIDLFWRDSETISNSDYWISYSYLDTERNYRDFPNQAAPAFSSKHNFSIVYKYFISSMRTQVGATYSFASGRPYNDPNQNSFQSGRTISYHDLSVNISYLVKDNMILYVSATNLMGRENVFGFEYQTESQPDGVYADRPVILPAKRFLFVGFFITLSKENTMNQLPNL